MAGHTVVASAAGAHEADFVQCSGATWQPLLPEAL